MQPRVTIQLVGWNSAKALPIAVRGLRDIGADRAIVRYLDNGSTDDSVRIIREGLPQAEVIEFTENKGFAGAHNEGFRRCTTPLVITLNPDLELHWAGIEKILSVFEDPKVGAVQGKLLRLQDSVVSLDASAARSPRANSASQSGSLGSLPQSRLSRVDSRKIKIIDSVGIMLTVALNGKERGANEEDRGQYEASSALIAVTGACGLYRLEALKAVAYTPPLDLPLGKGERTEVFDEDFFAYKEDVDLGWRLNRAGWKVVYEPVLMGQHARTMQRTGVFGWGLHSQHISERMLERRTHYSFRNWVWMVVKNATFGQYLLHKLFVTGRLLIFLVLSLRHPSFFRVWAEMIRGLPNMWRKRYLPEKL